MIDKKIIEKLKATNRYSRLIKNYESQQNYGYAFEIYFAYTMELGDVQLTYEKKPTPGIDKTVDFLFEQGKKKIWFELVCPDYNESINTNINDQMNNTGVYQIVLQSDHSNNHFDHAGQIIRLQDKILEKTSKFTNPSDSNFNILVVACSKIQVDLINTTLKIHFLDVLLILFFKKTSANNH